MSKHDGILSVKYVGVDLHSTQFTCCFLGEDGVQRSETYSVDEEGFRKFQGMVDANTYIMVEATKGSFKFWEIMHPHVRECLIANTYKLKLISMVGKKTDKIDAEKLAKFLKMQIQSNEQLFRPVYVPEAEIQALRSLFASYKFLNRQSTMTKNMIHALFKQQLLVIERRDLASQVGRRRIMEIPLPDFAAVQVKIMMDNLESIEAQRSRIEDEIYKVGRKYEKQIDILTSINGISPLIALALMADIADVSRFPNAKHMTSYLRSVPDIDSSNNSTKILRTTKQGRKLSITLLTQAIIHVRRANTNLLAWDQKKRGKKSAGRIRMAECRKTFVHIYHMLKNGEYYRFRQANRHKVKMNEFRNRLIKLAA